MPNLLCLYVPEQDCLYGGNPCDRTLILRILEVRDSQITGPVFYLGLSDAIAEEANPIPGTVQATYWTKDNTLRISWIDDASPRMSGRLACDIRLSATQAWSMSEFPKIENVVGSVPTPKPKGLGPWPLS